MSDSRSEVDFFISRRGASAEVAQEVATVLQEEGYTVLVQDYDFGYATDFIAAIDNALKRCRHLILLLTRDYATSEYTMMEATNFLAAAGRSVDERRLVILRLDDTTPEGILASRVYADLAGIDDAAERRRRILAAAEGRSTATQRRHKLFENVAPRDLNFAGRDDILTELHRLLREAEGAPGVTSAAIYGLGGMGKSSVAAEYAHRFAGEYSGVWWAPAEQRTLLTSSLASLAGKLDPRLADEADQEKAAKAGLARLAGFTTPFLLIYDNVENPEALRELLPLSGARVLITTRWTDWAGRAAEIKLDLLAEDAAAQFLQTRAGRQDPAGAAGLAKALGCLPLALDHAGAYCRLAGASMSFDAYRNKIDARILRAPKGYPDSVARTFSLAIEKASLEHPAAERLLGFFAFLAPDHIPLDLIDAELLDEDDRIEALMALSAVSLVEHQTLQGDAAGLNLHRLVQAAMRGQLASQERAVATITEVLHCLALAVPEAAYGEPRHWPRCAQLLPHVLALRAHVATAKIEGADLAQLCDRMGEFLYARGSLDLAKTFFSDAIAAGKNAFGTRHVGVAKAMNNLANVLQDLGPTSEAESLLREALDIQLQISGQAHPSYARTLTSLARVLQEAGQRDEAEAKLREAIALGEQSLGRAHPDVTARLNNLAMLLYGKGERSEAENLVREAIALGEKAFGREHPHVLARLGNLAFILQNNGKLDESDCLYREVIASGERVFGPDHRNMGTWLQNFANLLRDTNREQEAEQHYARALQVLLLNLGAEHILTARARCNFARLLVCMGRAQEARDLAQAALAIHAKALGPNHIWTKESAAVVNLASAIQPPRHADTAVLPSSI